MRFAVWLPNEKISLKHADREVIFPAIVPSHQLH